MALTFTGSGAGLFDRFGALAGGVADWVALKGGAATARVLSGASMQTRGTTLETYAALSPAVSAALGDHWAVISAFVRQAPPQFAKLAEAIFVDQVHQDNPLQTKNLANALAECIRQMQAGGDDINASAITLGAQTALGSPTGDPIIVLSEKRTDGLKWQTLFPETLRFTCTGDSYTGGQTARRETLTVKGAARVTDPFDRLWPGGSGASRALTLADAQADSTANVNLLRNSDFETASASNYFDNWVHGSGAAGTDFFANGSGYTGSNALKIQGGGVTNPTIYQEFNKAASTVAGAGGTSTVLLPRRQYALCFRGKKTVATAGALRFALVDSTGTVIADDSAVDNSASYDVTAWTTSFVGKTAVFRTPAALPADGVVRLEAQLTTNLTDATEDIVLDDLCMVEMVNLYGGGVDAFGVHGAAFAGAAKVKLNDAWTVAVGNTMGVLAMWLERLFGLAARGVIVPYNEGGTETIADSVVQ